MGYYAIGIGGTGAKCLESLIHLAAAGMMPDNDDLYILFVDPDDANGSLDRANTTLNHYKAFHDNNQLSQSCMLQTKIDSATNPIFSPFDKQDDDKPNLSGFFKFPSLKLAKDNAADLFEVLYSEKERDTKLNEGFRGHPSIGASVMAQTVLGEDEPWKTFRVKIEKDPNPKIFLAGSIFGGTGASGFPTIAKLIKSELKPKPVNEQIGGALVLPYFTFTDTGDNKNELKAKAEHFLMNTQAALEYYHLWNKDLVYNAIYLIGNDSQIKEENFSLGGMKQRNSQHFIELYAALAAIHFFGDNPVVDDGAQYFRLNRANNPHKWSDLPDGANGTKIQSKLCQLTNFSFAYLSTYKPMLDDIFKEKRSGFHTPWYIDFFKRKKISLNNVNVENSLNNVKDYCEDFLVWIANVQNSQKGKPLNTVDSFDLTKCGNLISSDTLKPLSPAALDKIWEKMCSANGKGEGTDIGKFLSTLYQICGTV